MLAVLLMIAVAVAAALITYAWVMTYLESTTSRAGHAIQIQSVAFNNATDPDEATVYTQNVGDGAVTISDSYVDGTLFGIDDELLAEGSTIGVVVEGTYVSGGEYKFKVVCKDGTFTSGTYTMP